MKLDNIVKLALDNYDKEFVSVNFFVKATSVIYKLVDTTSQVYALKIYENASSLIDNQIEILMHEAINKKGTITIPEIIKNKEGQHITTVDDKIANTVHRIILSKWLPGVNLKNNENEVLFFEIGKLVAELHLITQEIVIPTNLQPRQWDCVFYFRDEIPVYQEKKYEKIVSLEFKELMDRAIPIFNDRLKRIYESGTPQLLHGDLNPWNIKVNNEEISILDFEDAILGQPIQELAILLFYYKDNEQYSYEFVKKSILDGYKSVNPIAGITDEDIAFLSMARTVNFLNYVLTLEEDSKAFIKRSLQELKVFLESYG